jgi:hypothetical protein
MSCKTKERSVSFAEVLQVVLILYKVQPGARTAAPELSKALLAGDEQKC